MAIDRPPDDGGDLEGAAADANELDTAGESRTAGEIRGAGAGNGGETDDARRSIDGAPDSPSPETAADSPADTKAAEPRTRQQHGDVVPPPALPEEEGTQSSADLVDRSSDPVEHNSDPADSRADPADRRSDPADRADQEEALPGNKYSSAAEDSAEPDDSPASPEELPADPDDIDADPPAAEREAPSDEAGNESGGGADSDSPEADPSEDDTSEDAPLYESIDKAHPDEEVDQQNTPADENDERTGQEADEAPDPASSPDEDGDASDPATREQPPKPDHDIQPVEDRPRPRTDQERAEHIANVFARLDKADADGLSADDLHTIDPNGEIWSSDRTLLHNSLLDDVYAQSADVPCDHEAIVAGGLSGAGKTTVLANHPEIDQSRYLTINPDNLKEEMALRDMIPEVEGLSPMEASDLVHEESSYLARQLALRAQADGKNLIWDITMSDQAKTEQRITDLREAGYTKVDGLFVDIPIETSLRRTQERYWADQNKWFAGEGLGGRLIPPAVILRQADEEWGSRNRKTFEAIKSKVNDWEIQDNSVDHRPAILVELSKQKDTGKNGE